jgi:hypothetical protein
MRIPIPKRLVFAPSIGCYRRLPGLPIKYLGCRLHPIHNLTRDSKACCSYAVVFIDDNFGRPKGEYDE